LVVAGENYSILATEPWNTSGRKKFRKKNCRGLISIDNAAGARGGTLLFLFRQAKAFADFSANDECLFECCPRLPARGVKTGVSEFPGITGDFLKAWS